MKIIESFIRDKYPDQSLCEDGIFIGTRIAAVVDGATAHGKLLWKGGSSGHFAKEVLIEYLRENEEELAGLSAEECLLRLNDVLAEKGEEVHPGKKAIVEYPRASVILFNSEAGEVWSYGDCQCMIGGAWHRDVKEVDRLMSELRAVVVWSDARERAATGQESEGALKGASTGEAKVASEGAPEGTSAGEAKVVPDSERIAQHDVGREAVVTFIERQYWFENAAGPFGFPVLNGVNFAAEMVKVWPVPDGAEVVLASDGYPELCGTLAESEKRLREVIEEDPLCIGRNAGTKGIMKGMESFDDRAFVRVV